MRWEPPAEYARGTERPVVVLPGVYETWHFLRAMTDALNRRGHPIHVVSAMGFNRHAIPETAEAVAADLRARRLRGVALLAHSKGGLIGKHLLSNDAEGRIDRLVAVATPFGGSRLARFAVGGTLRAFRPTDPVIRALADQRQINARITSIYPRIDPNIPDGSRLDGATNIEIPIIGHFRVLTAAATIDAVVTAIEA